MPDNKKTDAADAETQPEPTSAPLVSAETSAAHAVASSASADSDNKADPELEKAVDDIAAKESDEVLAAEDAELEHAFDPKPKTGFKQKLKQLVSTWWNNKKLRYGTLAGLAAFILLVAGLPQSRYFVLNNVGIRSSASITVLDNSTQQPLKNVEVTLAHVTAKTGSDGKVYLTHLKLGPSTLTISRRAFATATRNVTVGWGSNPLGNTKITPTGSQYTFHVNGFLSSKGVAKAEATAGDADAIADDNGQLVLTVEPGEGSSLTVTIKAENYRDLMVPINLDDKNAHTVTLVPSQKHAFVSKRSGKYDLYSIDVDGANEKLLLAGTGNERPDISVVPNPSASVVAFVSSRDTVRNSDGYLLETLNVIDLKTGNPTLVTRSERIQIIDWVGNKLIFAQVAAGASANNPNRQRLISYDFTTNSQKELASSNYFYDLVSAGGSIYYANSELNQSNQAGFFKINPDGTNRITILNKTVWNIFRTQYNHLSLSVGDDWYDFKVGDVTTTKLPGAPASQQNRVYQDDSSHGNSLWVDSRDGKGVLLKYDIAAQKDTVLRTQSGLSTPFYWLNNHYAVYRIQTDQETADYVISLDGGQPRKISDVTNTHGLGQWYYYQ
jgi:hypothetical protein